MANTTLIEETCYEIIGGKTLIGGTEYSIDKGRSLVLGTEQFVLFDSGSAIPTITIEGAGNKNYCYLSINGTKYISPATLEVEIGTVITCMANGRECECGRYGGLSSISVYGKGTYDTNYNYTVKENALIELYYKADECKDCDDNWRDCTVSIKEESTIVFSIDVEIYFCYAKKEMTWAEYIDSDFINKPSNLTNNGDSMTMKPMGSTSTRVIQYNGVNVLPTDVIISGATYTTMAI